MKDLANLLIIGIFCGAIFTIVGNFVDNKKTLYAGGIIGGIGIGASYGIYKTYRDKKDSERK